MLRLVAYNGAVAEHLDEKFSDIQNNLSNSKLLHSFAEGQFNMCYGLAKLPRRTQVKIYDTNFVLDSFQVKLFDKRNIKFRYFGIFKGNQIITITYS